MFSIATEIIEKLGADGESLSSIDSHHDKGGVYLKFTSKTLNILSDIYCVRDIYVYVIVYMTFCIHYRVRTYCVHFCVCDTVMYVSDIIVYVTFSYKALKMCKCN